MGIRHFDTAPLYGAGLSEIRLGKALTQLSKNNLKVSSKVGYKLKRGRSKQSLFRANLCTHTVPDYSYDAAMRSVEGSMRRLGLEFLDTVYIHDLDLIAHDKNSLAQSYDATLEGAYIALTELRANGLVKRIGLGVNDPTIVRRALTEMSLDVVMLARSCSLLNQTDAAEVKQLCSNLDKEFVVAGPYQSGILSGADVSNPMYNYSPASTETKRKVAEIKRICAAHGVPMYAAALQFPLRIAGADLIACGVKSMEELHQLKNGLEHEIHTALWQELCGDRFSFKTLRGAEE